MLLIPDLQGAHHLCSQKESWGTLAGTVQRGDTTPRGTGDCPRENRGRGEKVRAEGMNTKPNLQLGLCSPGALGKYCVLLPKPCYRTSS